MKKKKICYYLLFAGFLILPFIGMVVAATPSYVGIEEDDVFVWITDYDNETNTLLYQDDGFNYFPSLDEDVEAIRIRIEDIDNGEEDYGGEDGVEIIFNYYETDDKDDREWKVDYNEKTIIFDYDVYVYFSLPFYGVFFVDKNADWEEVGDRWEDYFEDFNIDGDVTTWEHGISLGWIESGLKEFDLECQYTDDGVLRSYDFEYDGHSILEAELETTFFDEFYFYIILGIVLIAVIVTVAIVAIILVKHKKKERRPMISAGMEQPAIAVAAPASVPTPPPTEKRPEIMFCPMCGNKNKIKSNFCIECGANLME